MPNKGSRECVERSLLPSTIQVHLLRWSVGHTVNNNNDKKRTFCLPGNAFLPSLLEKSRNSSEKDELLASILSGVASYSAIVTTSSSESWYLHLMVI